MKFQTNRRLIWVGLATALASVCGAFVFMQTRPPQPRNTDSPLGVQDQSRKSGTLVLRSPAVVNGEALPVEYTGDGSGLTPPLEWSGEPAGTKYFAIIMHHIPGPGTIKWYWTLYNIPANVHSLPKNATGVGILGNNSINNRVGYAPPHSKGPGPKTYILTVYALSAPVQITAAASEVNRAVLLTAMKSIILDSAELKVIYDRTGIIDSASKGRPPVPGILGKDAQNL